jgi:predicted HAD superfamily Cof-like phosphohydrolase
LGTARLKQRLECLIEELMEFRAAVTDGNLPEMADALVDLVVFAKGTAVLLGLPWAALFDDVMRANLSKVRGVGKRGHKVDLVKPEGWRGPQTRDILFEHGWNPEEPPKEDADDTV